MKKASSIFLLIFYVSAQCLLPKGNFAYIAQVPRLYADFCKENNTQDVFEFLEEQFIEIASNESDADEPFEKESKSVPFYTVDTTCETAFVREETTEFISMEESRQNYFIYVLKKYSAPVSSIDQPPETCSV